MTLKLGSGYSCRVGLGEVLQNPDMIYKISDQKISVCCYAVVSVLVHVKEPAYIVIDSASLSIYLVSGVACIQTFVTS